MAKVEDQDSNENDASSQSNLSKENESIES